MLFDNTHSVQEYCDLDLISMKVISDIVRKIILYPNTFSNFKQITYTIIKGERILSPHS